MEIKQFAEFVSAVVRSLPRDMDSTTAQGWIENQAALAKILHEAIMPNYDYDLYLAPEQLCGGWINGLDLEKHLKESGLIDRTLSLDDQLVQNWIKSPSTFPKELKGKKLILWKSQDSTYSKELARKIPLVAYLFWYCGRVLVDSWWLENPLSGKDPVLLSRS